MNAYMRILFLAIFSLIGATAQAQSQQQYNEQAARAQRDYKANARAEQREYRHYARSEQRFADEQAWQDSRPYYPSVYYAPAPQVVYIEPVRRVYVEPQPDYAEPQGYVRLSRYGAEAVLQINGGTFIAVQSGSYQRR